MAKSAMPAKGGFPMPKAAKGSSMKPAKSSSPKPSKGAFPKAAKGGSSAKGGKLAY